jgi:hypothetical protein
MYSTYSAINRLQAYAICSACLSYRVHKRGLGGGGRGSVVNVRDYKSCRLAPAFLPPPPPPAITGFAALQSTMQSRGLVSMRRENLNCENQRETGRGGGRRDKRRKTEGGKKEKQRESWK